MAQKANVFIFMGVCGCGKTAISNALKNDIENRLKDNIKVSLIDGDDLHSKSNKSKMKQGIPLNDRDRIPWLISIRNTIEQHKPLFIMHENKSKHVRHLLFITCSALKYSYREILRRNKNSNTDDRLCSNIVSFIMLDTKRETLEKRLINRQHEYMSPTLLESQLNTLEFPNTKFIENDILIVSNEGSVQEITAALLNKIVSKKNILIWRQTQRISSIVSEYNQWYNNKKRNKINLFLELMYLYPMERCIADFISIYANAESKEMICNLLNIKVTNHSLYSSIHSFNPIMSELSNQSLYCFVLHCILCYFYGIEMNEIMHQQNDDINQLDSAFVDIIKQSQFNNEEKYAIKLLLEMNQDFVFRKWGKLSIADEKKKKLLSQIIKLDAEYPDGLQTYYKNARRLMKQSSLQINPYSLSEGWQMNEIDANRMINLEFNSDSFNKYEAIGRTQFGLCGFILLGGGFGERLGYKGIKTGLPADICSSISYIELYIKTLLAFQERARRDLNKPDLLLPFACTTSGIGHDLTAKLLKDNKYFGLLEEQFTFLPQTLVASFSNYKCDFAFTDEECVEIQEKPHGHGDVHSLMYQTETAQKWYKQLGIKWMIILQDTNAVAIRTLASALGVSCDHNFAMNSVATPRLKGQSYGAMVKLINNKKGKELITNIEYNQLNEDDVKDGTLSPYPANTNTLIIRCDTYCDVLNKTHGVMTEFVNPKFVDPQKRNKFTKATRLETMVQDYTKLLFEQGFVDKIGVTTLPKWMALQPVKKNIYDSQTDAKHNKNNMAELSAANGESAVYCLNRKYLHSCGVDIELGEDELKMFNGINVKYGARIVLLPSFSITLNEMKERFKNAEDEIKITKKSTLILDGNIVINKLYLNGTLIIKTGPKYGDKTKIIIDGLRVENKGWHFEEIKDLNDKNIDDIYKLRGYTLEKINTKCIEFDDGKLHIIS